MANILEHKHHLLVLSTSLPWSVMRAQFLAGADDVGDKPYDRGRLVEIVTQALDRSTPRDSYEAAKPESVVHLDHLGLSNVQKQALVKDKSLASGLAMIIVAHLHRTVQVQILCR